jgi:hypothetical protein
MNSPLFLIIPPPIEIDFEIPTHKNCKTSANISKVFLNYNPLRFNDNSSFDLIDF